MFKKGIFLILDSQFQIAFTRLDFKFNFNTNLNPTLIKIFSFFSMLYHFFFMNAAFARQNLICQMNSDIFSNFLFKFCVIAQVNKVGECIK